MVLLLVVVVLIIVLLVVIVVVVGTDHHIRISPQAVVARPVSRGSFHQKSSLSRFPLDE